MQKVRKTKPADDSFDNYFFNKIIISGRYFCLLPLYECNTFFFSITSIKMDETIKKKKYLNLFHKTHSNKTAEKDITVFNRLNLNKMLNDKPPVLDDDSHKWLS